MSEEVGYLPELVFCVHETHLSWKRIPDHMFIAKEEILMPCLNAAKDNVTQLLEGNAAGDSKLKTLLMYHNGKKKAVLYECDKVVASRHMEV
jgi:hypothetical protein